MDCPSLSVIIPNYNHGHYISEAIDSVLEQSYPSTELIVVDDASTDDSIQILESYARCNKNIRLIKNFSNMGPGYTVQRGFVESKSDYWYTLAADDKVFPGFFKKTIDLLERYPKAGMCSVYMNFIDEKSRVIPHSQLPFFHTHETHISTSTPEFLTSGEVKKILSKKPWFIGGLQPVISRRSALAEAGGVNPEFSLLADWYAVHFMALKFGMCYLHEPLVAFRLLHNSFGMSIALHPDKVIANATSVFRLMEDPKNCHIFPNSFIEANRRNWSYSAFRASFVDWHLKRQDDLERLIPPKTIVDILLKKIMQWAMRIEQLLLKVYCFRNIPAVFYRSAKVAKSDLFDNKN